jgi:hypothetical protein
MDSTKEAGFIVVPGLNHRKINHLGLIIVTVVDGVSALAVFGRFRVQISCSYEVFVVGENKL